MIHSRPSRRALTVRGSGPPANYELADAINRYIVYADLFHRLAGDIL